MTWTDSAGDESGTSQGIRATVYAASGNVVPNAGDILVNQFNQAGTQQSNDVTALADGGFEVVWEDIAAGVDRNATLCRLPTSMPQRSPMIAPSTLSTTSVPATTTRICRSCSTRSTTTSTATAFPTSCGRARAVRRQSGKSTETTRFPGAVAGSATILGQVGLKSRLTISTATDMPTFCGRIRSPAKPRSGK